MVEAELTEDDAYEVLGLAVGIAPEQVDAVHRRLASRAHPDRWLTAAVDEQEAVRGRFEEVNEAYRTLKAARKAGLGSPTNGSGPSAPRRRTTESDASRPARPEPVHHGGVSGMPVATPSDIEGFFDIEDDPVRRVPGGLVAATLAVAVVVAVVAAIGLSSPSADGGRQRSVLGPLAYQFWEAERLGDHGAMWDLAEDRLKATVDRDGFARRLDACPRRRPSRTVARIDSARGGLWEVESIDPSGSSGLSYFRQEATYRFGAVLVEPDLADLLAAPPETAANLAWCQRR